ncbi:MAG: response regulator transcription factor [Flavobacteriales bacterium]|nr:response regulator transcription factor [Flavobacteriales bacterium]
MRILRTDTAKAPRVMLALIGLEDGGPSDVPLVTTAYVLPGVDPSSLLQLISKIEGGDALDLDGSVRKVTVQLQGEGVKENRTALSNREKDVLRALVDGLSYKMIAGKLGVSYETVNSHIKRVYKKLAVNSNTEAVAKALNEHLLAS